jgi:hypothetical protein
MLFKVIKKVEDDQIEWVSQHTIRTVSRQLRKLSPQSSGREGILDQFPRNLPYRHMLCLGILRMFLGTRKFHICLSTGFFA